MNLLLFVIRVCVNIREVQSLKTICFFKFALKVCPVRNRVALRGLKKRLV